MSARADNDVDRALLAFGAPTLRYRSFGAAPLRDGAASTAPFVARAPERTVPRRLTPAIAFAPAASAKTAQTVSDLYPLLGWALAESAEIAIVPTAFDARAPTPVAAVSSSPRVVPADVRPSRVEPRISLAEQALASLGRSYAVDAGHVPPPTPVVAVVPAVVPPAPAIFRSAPTPRVAMPAPRAILDRAPAPPPIMAAAGPTPRPATPIPPRAEKQPLAGLFQTLRVPRLGAGTPPAGRRA